MKPGLLLKMYALILLVIFGGVVLHAPLSVGLGTLLPDFELAIKSWKEILMLPATLLALWLVWRAGAWREFAKDRILQLIAVYAALHVLLAAAVLTGPLATLAGLVIDLRYALFFVLVYVLVKLAPAYRQPVIRVGIYGAAVVVGFGALQLFLPADILKYIGYSENTIQPYLTVDKNPDFIRINSTLRGPNPLGAYIVMVLALLAAAVVRGKLVARHPKEAFLVGLATLASLMVLWVSYSRSAVAAAGMAVLIVLAAAGRRFISRRVWIAGSVVLFALAGGIFLGRDHSFITNVVLHENREGGSAISSNDDHVESLVEGTKRMLAQPLGGGIGSTGSASLMSDEPLIIENQYLFIAHEVGWLGLGLFVALFALILIRLWHQRNDWLSLGVLASGIGLAAIGVLLPVWADDTVSIVWWGLAATAIASGGKDVRKRTRRKSAEQKAV